MLIIVIGTLLYIFPRNIFIHNHYYFYAKDKWDRDFGVFHFHTVDTLVLVEIFDFKDEENHSIYGTYKNDYLRFISYKREWWDFKFSGRFSDDISLYQFHNSGDTTAYYWYKYSLKQITKQQYDSILFFTKYPHTLPNFYTDTIVGNFRLEFIAHNRNIKNKYGEMMVCVYDKNTQELLQTIES